MRGRTKKELAKQVVYGQVACVGWVLLYMLLELVGIALIMYYNAMNNLEFGKKFLEVFNFLEDKTLSDLEYSVKVAEGLMKLTNEIVLPMLVLSGVLLIVVLFIKGKVKKERYVKAVSINKVSKYLLIGTTLNLVITLIIGLVPESLMESYSTSIGLATTGNVFLLVLATGIMGPIAEEITFRHFIMIPNRKVNDTYAIIISALAFGIMHGNLIQGSYAFVLGLVFAREDIKENNLTPSLIMHMTINTSSVLIASAGVNEILALAGIEFIAVLIYMIVHRPKAIESFKTAI